MKKKKLSAKHKASSPTGFILLLSSAVILIVFTSFLSSKDKGGIKSTQLKQTPTPFPTIHFDLPEIPDTEKIEISGVEVKNFYKGAVNIGQIGEALIVNKVEYTITYYPLDNAFLIVILRWPFEEIREKAEQDFLESLSLTKNQACKLAVYITTPRYANPGYEGKNWPLSFCK